MAKPIEATPVLLGKSARRFDKLMANVKFHPIRSRKIDWDEFDRLLEVKRSRSIETTKNKRNRFKEMLVKEDIPADRDTIPMFFDLKELDA